MLKTRIYVGCGVDGTRTVISTATPTRAVHGHAYFALIGPFRTRAGATVMRNAHGCVWLQTVAQCEHWARCSRNCAATSRAQNSAPC